MTRLFIYSNKDGSREGVYFTEDDSIDVTDVVPPGCSLDYEGDLEDGLPATFPLDHNLER